MSQTARLQIIANNQPDLVEPFIKTKDDARMLLLTSFNPSSVRFLMEDIIQGLTVELLATETELPAWQIQSLLDTKSKLDVFVIHAIMKYCGLNFSVPELIKVLRPR